MQNKSGRLDASFYQREDVVQLSKTLLGKVLVTRIDGHTTSGKIVETEAYRAPEDKASHAYNYRRTQRTETMFRAGGVAYVYLCYGIHHLFNVVTGPAETPHAILIRGIEPIDNVHLMLQRRNFKKLTTQLTAGPGVLSKALGIDRSHDGESLSSNESKIWIEDRGLLVPDKDIISSPRVGIDYAQECAAWPWRFRIRDNPWCSKAK